MVPHGNICPASEPAPSRDAPWCSRHRSPPRLKLNTAPAGPSNASCTPCLGPGAKKGYYQCRFPGSRRRQLLKEPKPSPAATLLLLLLPATWAWNHRRRLLLPRPLWSWPSLPPPSPQPPTQDGGCRAQRRNKTSGPTPRSPDADGPRPLMNHV